MFFPLSPLAGRGENFRERSQLTYHYLWYIDVVAPRTQDRWVRIMVRYKNYFSFVSVCIFCWLFLSLTYQINHLLFPGYNLYDIHRILELVLLFLSAFFFVLQPRYQKLWGDTFFSLPLIIRYGLLVVLLLGGLSSLLAPLPKICLINQIMFSLIIFLLIILIRIS